MKIQNIPVYDYYLEFIDLNGYSDLNILILSFCFFVLNQNFELVTLRCFMQFTLSYINFKKDVLKKKVNVFDLRYCF